MNFKRQAGSRVPNSPAPTLSVQVRLLIYVTAVVFVLAGLEMILLAFSGNTSPESSLALNANGLQSNSQHAALATANPQLLQGVGNQLPNSKEEAAAFSKNHQSSFNFNDSASTYKAAGFDLKTNLKLAPAGSKLKPVSDLQAALDKQQQLLAQVQPRDPNHLTSAPPDNYEPDDTPQQANQLTVTTAPDLSGTQTHTFTTVNDIDWVYIVARKTNINYTIFTNALNITGVDTRLDLYDSNLNLVASNDDAAVQVGDNPKNSTITFTPTVAGTYYIKVSDVALDGAAGAYFLTAYQENLGNTATATPTAIATYTPAGVTPTSTPLPCADAYEPDNNPSQAKPINPSLSTLAAFGTTGLPSVDPNNDGTQARSICPSGDIDWIYMDLVTGKPYSVFTSSLRGGLDTFIVLYSVDSSGNVTPLFSNDDFPNAGLASRIDWVVPTTATTPAGTPVRYYLAVKDVAGHGGPNETYNLTLATIGSPSGDCNDFYQPDYGPTTAKDIQINESQTHVFCPAGNSHWVRLYAKASRTYAIRTAFAVGAQGLDTSITVYSVQFDPNTPNKVVATTRLPTQNVATNAVANDLSSTVIFSVPADGYYYAQVSNAGNNGQPGLSYSLIYTTSTGAGTNFNATQTAVSTQTVGGAGAPQTATVAAAQTATANVGSSGSTATAVALTVFAVNGTQTAIAYTATAQGTPNPTQQTANAIASATSTALGTPAATATRTALATTGSQNQPSKLSNANFADLSFNNVWNQLDKAVAEGVANRSWEYGPKPGPQKLEPYVEANGGTRQVQYFSKSRMEINNPKANRSTAWFVTNGLLVKEMISGALALGDNKYQMQPAPQIPVAGDLSGDNFAPTYASFSKLITINNSNRADNRTGQLVGQSLNHDGSLNTLANPPEQVKLSNYVPETGHNIADKFWDYLNSQGTVYQDGQYTNAQLMDWVFVMGLPLTEPVWVKAKVGGIERDVLVQVFERRILTYTPSNNDGWKVEMGNVGEHYYLWRYGVSLYADGSN